MNSASTLSNSPVFISIVGASCSGKTALASNLAKRFSDQQVSVISEDNYYKRQDQLSAEQREKMNYDHPNAFDYDLLFEHVAQLKSGQSIQCPTYDYALHNRSETTIEVQATPVIICEGIMLYHSERLRNLFSLKLYVDTPLDICLARRVARDVSERSRSVESVLTQYQSTVRPMYLEFIEPSKYNADIIFPMGGYNNVALDVLESRIAQLVGA
jgi:uridine kinase